MVVTRVTLRTSCWTTVVFRIVGHFYIALSEITDEPLKLVPQNMTDEVETARGWPIP